MTDQELFIPTNSLGLCECGCGEKTRIAATTITARGQIKGQPVRFISGHNSRVNPPSALDTEYIEEERGFDTPCWIWQGCVNRNGYGQKRADNRLTVAHRHYYKRYRGAISEELVADHLCQIRNCVNPWHIELVTNRENVMRGLVRKRLAGEGRFDPNRKTGTNPARGVYASHGGKRWEAQISVQGECKYLGTFDTVEKASSARKAAELTYRSDLCRTTT